MFLLAVEQNDTHDGAHADPQHHSQDKEADTLSQVIVFNFSVAKEDTESNQETGEGDASDRQDCVIHYHVGILCEKVIIVIA